MPKPKKWKIDKLDRRESVGISELQRRIKEARRRVAVIVASAARDRKILISGRNREHIYAQVGSVYAQLDLGLKDWGKDLIEKTAIDWHDAAIRDVREQTGVDPSNSVTRFSREYAEDVFKRVHPENGKSLAAVLTEKMAEADKKALRGAVTDVFREGSLTGRTMTQMAADIKTRWDGIAGDLSANRFVDAAGRTWDDGRYAQMLVRTTVARVSRDSYFDTLTKNGDDLAIIQNVDGEACDICGAWDGVIVSITGNDDRYPSYNDALNAGWGHPNCRCTAERVDETIDADEIKAQAEAETPDFERKEDEKASAYQSRITEAVADYSKDFGVDEINVKLEHSDGESHDNTEHIRSEDRQMDKDYADARRTGEIAEGIFDELRSENVGAAFPPEVARSSAAEIAAVCIGRKPLYHDQLNESASRIASGLSKHLPVNVFADSYDGHLSVYNKSLVEKIMDSDKKFYRLPEENTLDTIRRLVASGECGELLGFGARRIDTPRSVLVLIKDGDKVIGGFRAPEETADVFARARVLDYALYLRKPISYEIR